MKALSIWQPWASLIISGHKRIETRGWAAPYSIRGQRIAIAATKTIRPEQRQAVQERIFQEHYSATGHPSIDDLPLSCVLGTVVIDGCRGVDPEFMQQLSPREEAFGNYGPGRFAWFLSDPQPLPTPIPVKGAQGLWNCSVANGSFPAAT